LRKRSPQAPPHLPPIRFWGCEEGELGTAKTKRSHRPEEDFSPPRRQEHQEKRRNHRDTETQRKTRRRNQEKGTDQAKSAKRRRVTTETPRHRGRHGEGTRTREPTRHSSAVSC